MLSARIRDFINDESGAYTVWSLVWFSLYVAIGGLAVDMTDGYRTQSLLQSTADASVLAAVMSLPDENDGRQQAVNFSKDNMLQNDHGTVVRSSEVVFGTWTISPASFQPGGVEPNAAMVTARRADANENPLATNFLRIIGLVEWDVNAIAIATRFYPDCLLAGNALIAGNRVDITSNNVLANICIHGENLREDPAHDYAVEIQNNGTIYEDTQISMPDEDMMIDRPTICSNQGLCEPGVVTEGNLMPAEALAIGTLIGGMLDETSEDYLQGDLYGVDGDGNTLFPPYNYIDLQNCAACVALPDADGIPTTTDFEYIQVMQPNNVYVFSCNDPMDVLVLPDPLLQPVLQDVAVISECRINGQSNSVLEGVTLASSAIGGGAKGYEKAVIKFPSNVTFGADDNCAPGGNVGLYAAATVQIAAGASIDGLRIVAGGDVQLNANETADDLNVIAGHNIYFTANADIGTGCVGNAEGPLVYRYRLVH
ncbi:MAG: pilus assembly protein TadG-related protein [Paracoccaceae bacterium]|nr:pilus assembly protein TadG-related protein [Paracoccaceae bacterium]